MHKLAVITLFLSPHAFSQNEPIITDRPDITESAVTVPHSSLQIETGFIFQKNLESINGINTQISSISIAGTLLRYGIFSFAELRAGAEYLSQEAKILGINETARGISGIFIGSKIQLVRDHTEIPDAAVFFHLNLSEGHENLRPEKAEPEILIAVSHNIFEPFLLSYNFGGTWDSSDKMVKYFYSSSLGVGLSDKIAIYAELFGEFSSGFSVSYNFDAGLAYLFLENLQMDISSGFNFEKPGENWFISSGFSIRLPE